MHRSVEEGGVDSTAIGLVEKNYQVLEKRREVFDDVSGVGNLSRKFQIGKRIEDQIVPVGPPPVDRRLA